MPRFALIDTTDDSLIELRNFPSQPANPAGKPRAWLPCDPVSKPSHDPKAEKVNGPTYTVNVEDVTESWSVVSLTAQEISDAKDLAVDGLNGSVYKALFLAILSIVNDIRTTKSKLNALIDATGQSVAVPKFSTGQVSQIDGAQLKSAVKALL